jgi:TRAP-type C4-dicarboxylate transport system substrate-binding protein
LRPIFDREYEKYNAKVLYHAQAQTIQIINKKSQLQTLDEFKGLKVRVLGPEPAEALKALGASPVSVSLGEIYTSLQRGVIDGAMTNEGSSLGTRLYEVCKYFIAVNFQEFMCHGFVNLESFNALPKDLQKTVMDAAAWMEAINFAGIRKDTEQDRAALKEKGVQIIKMPSAELAKIKNKVAFVSKDWVAKRPVHKEAYDEALEVMSHLR